MKKRLILGALAILVTTACIWVYATTAHMNCSEAGPLWQIRGLCFWRRLLAFWPFAVYLAAWTWLGGKVMKAKGRNPAIGWVVGFFLQFLGCLGLLMLERKLTPEQKREQDMREALKRIQEAERRRR